MRAMTSMRNTFNGFVAASALSGSLMMAAPAFAQEDPQSGMGEEPVASQSVAPAAGDGSAVFEQSWLQQAGSPIDFNNPWALAIWPPALLALWMALRSVPMRARDVEFAPIFILEQLETFESEADQMVLAEKMLWAALVSAPFLAMSGPELIERLPLTQDGPLLMVIDTDWAAAPNWSEHRAVIHTILEQAHQEERDIIFLNTSRDKDGAPIALSETMNAVRAYSYVENLQTVPWPADREAALDALNALESTGSIGATYWISNGLSDDYSQALGAQLSALAPLQMYDERNTPLLMMPAENQNGNYTITIKRTDATLERTLEIQALAGASHVLASHELILPAGALEGEILFSAEDLGQSLSDVSRFKIVNENTAGATILVDDDYMPRSVGIVAVNGRNDALSLLNEARFMYAALQPYTEIHFGTAEELVRSNQVSVILVPDSIPLTGAGAQLVESWTREGGTLMRFAGPNMAQDQKPNDPLYPVTVIKGSVEGVDTNSYGETGLDLQDFHPDSPFTALDADDDVSVSRYVAIDDSRSRDYEVWANLSNGQPLVSMKTLGEGRTVLFHTTANTTWSDLALTDNFVGMLVSGVNSSTSVEDTQDYELPELPPLSVLNSAGETASPSGIVQPLDQSVWDAAAIGPENPPGLYGSSVMQVPFNLSHAVQDVQPMPPSPENVNHLYYNDQNGQQNIQGWLWAAAIGLGMAGSLMLGARNGAFTRSQPKPSRPDDTPEPGL